MKSGSRLPVVTLILIVANIVAAFALVIHPDLAYELGFRPNQPRVGDAVTSLFLHANLLHLLGNMVFLAAVCAAVELATGSIRFASVYFLSGLAGVALHYAMTRRVPDPAPFIGASGCIAGCAAYYSVRYTGLRVPVAPRLALSVLAVTVIWLLLQAVGAFVRLGDTGGTAFWAHLGGFATGILLSFLFRAPDLGQIRLGHEVLERMNAHGPAAVVIAAKQHLAKHPRDPKVLWELADALSQLSEHEQESEVLLRLADIAPAEEQAEVVRRLSQIGFVSGIPVLRRLQMADRFRTSDPFVARALLRSVVEGAADEPQRPEAMLSLAALEYEKEPEKAATLLRALQDEYPMHATVDMARKRGWLT